MGELIRKVAAKWGLAALLCATALTPLGGIAARAQASGSFQGLGFLEGYDSSSGAVAVNSDGSVVVGDSTRFLGVIGSVSQAFRWTQATGMVGLGFLGSYARNWVMTV